MKPADVDRVADWIIRRGLEGMSEADLLRAFCEQCTAGALPITRALAIIEEMKDLGHRLFRWCSSTASRTV
jgi:hypothetical protein